ncbi:hypothetical protein A3B58_00520 [Candidatus Amesbacteria bacterium RIFCSPLOWO2_01_FULL_48_50]|nr:MAG: hypothetical protein A2V48_00780 [Candidatus Amesbacteria bacterium RBG_19FT_COMBO_48_16]OGC99306.1 MAG: hypothetical protein A2W16_03895 [Candidatus Amesbacteria bacterium RBG_16_48_31]OGD07090.1 MAG: hypothetical protein A3B58_00520 [Candidatus Amesbacteria bacterium RIFCSPLOWO2_01_FULL_48_50]
MDLQKVNQLAWKRVDEYVRLWIGDLEVVMPYFTNDVGREFGKIMREVEVPAKLIKEVFRVYNMNGVPFGWYRGKGTPEQIKQAVAEIAKIHGVELESFTPLGLVEFMKMVGLGVDCSGFAYQVLGSAVGEENLKQVLDWESEEQEVYKAGVFTFAGRASEAISWEELQPLDLILLKKKDLVTYSHVALVLERQGWWVVQSTSTAVPMGVTVDRLKPTSRGPVFDFKPSRGESWEELWKQDRMELRRLKPFC